MPLEAVTMIVGVLIGLYLGVIMGYVYWRIQ